MRDISGLGKQGVRAAVYTRKGAVRQMSPSISIQFTLYPTRSLRIATR